MSYGIYPVFKPSVPNAASNTLGEDLAAELEALDALADEHGLTRLTSFADTREVPEGFDGPPEELENVMGPWEDWFPCGDGRLALEALARLITENAIPAKRLRAADAIAQELRAIARALAVGETQGAKFRLEMS